MVGIAMTYEEIIAKARKLASNGEVEAAKRAMAMAEGMRAKGDTAPQPDPVDGATPSDYFTDTRTGATVSGEMLARNMNMDAGWAAVTGGFQGSALGGADEVMGAALAVSPWRGGSVAERAKFGQEYTRAANERARQDHPLAYYGAMIPAAAVSTLGGWAALGVPLRGATAAGTVGRGVGMGAGEGAVIGALEGEGGKGRLMNGLMGLGLGAATGGAAVPAAWALQKAGTGAKNIVTGALEGITGKGNPGKAARAMQQTLERAGMSADDAARAVAQAAKEGQPEFRLMDALGQPGQRRASGIVRAGGDGANEIAEFLRQRGIDAPDRMAAFVDDAFPAQGAGDVAKSWVSSVPNPPDIPSVRTSKQAKDALDEARRAANRVTYGAASGAAKPVDVGPVVSTVDDLLKRDPLLDGTELKQTAIGRRLMGVRAQLSDDTKQLVDFDTVLNVKEDLGGIIGGLKTGGKPIPPQMATLYRSLDDALEKSSPMYRSANDAARGMRSVIGAVDEGAGMAAKRGRLEDTVGRFAAMSPEEQAAARAGYGNEIMTSLQSNKAAVPNVAREFGSTKRKAEAAAMAVDPDLLMRRTGREGTMAETYGRALGGSRTADNIADIEDLGMLADAGRAMRDLGTGNVPGAVRGGMGMLGRYVGPAITGQTAATRKMIADALISDDIKAALASATKAANQDAAKRALVAALLRRGNHPGYAQ